MTYDICVQLFMYRNTEDNIISIYEKEGTQKKKK